MNDIAFSVVIKNDGISDIIFKTIMLKGADGNSIASIEKTSTSGLVDTYTITLSDGSIGGTFTVTNGTLSAFDDHLDDSSTNAPQNKVVKDAIDGLDTRIDALENVTIDTELSSSSTNAVQNRAIKNAIDALSAEDIAFDNTGTGLASTDVQNAIADTLALIPAVDTALDDTSENAIENKAVKNALDSLASDLGDDIDAVEALIPTVDTNLNTISGNPIANSAVATALANINENTFRLIPSVNVPIDESIIDENTQAILTNCTGDYSNGYTFTSSNGSVEFVQISTNNTLYIVTFTMTNFNQGKIFVAFGNDEPADVYFGNADTQIVLKGNGGNLKITNNSYATKITNVKCYPVITNSENMISLALGTVIDKALVNELVTSGRWNVALGNENTFKDNVNATRCVAIGVSALMSLVSGTRNIGVGTFALHSLLTGDLNIAIGSDSLWNATKAKDCIAIGFNTMSGAGTDIEHNIAIGQDAMEGITTGKSNIAIGYGSMNSPQSNSVSYAVCIGQQAGNYANTNGTYIGNRAGYSLKGINNTCFGASAGSQTNTTGSQNIFIGVQSGIDNTGATSSNPKTVDNSIAMGFQVKATKSNQMILGNSNITEVVMCGNKKIVFNNDGTVTWEQLS